MHGAHFKATFLYRPVALKDCCCTFSAVKASFVALNFSFYYWVFILFFSSTSLSVVYLILCRVIGDTTHT